MRKETRGWAGLSVQGKDGSNSSFHILLVASSKWRAAQEVPDAPSAPPDAGQVRPGMDLGCLYWITAAHQPGPGANSTWGEWDKDAVFALGWKHPELLLNEELVFIMKSWRGESRWLEGWCRPGLQLERSSGSHSSASHPGGLASAPCARLSLCHVPTEQ